MLNDIKDEPEIIKKLAEVYLTAGKPVQNIEMNSEKISKIYIVASGSSRNAGNAARYFIESIAQIPVTVEHASEFAVRNPALSPDDLVIFVSQSGETSDVLSALQVAMTKGAYTFAVTNNETSTIHKTANSSMFIYAGKEISIPATKSFIAQLLCLYIIGIYLAERNNTISNEKIEYYKQKFYQIPEKIEKLIPNTEEIDKIAEKLHKTKSLIILGRGQNFGLAEEGALKIKETCYINAGGYPTGEFLHGHLAMLDENCPVISIITKCGQPNNDETNYMLAVGNTLQLIKKRNARVVVVKDAADSYINSKLSEFNVEYLNISDFDEEFSPVFTAVILHLLAYKMAELLGNDVNNPRSLSKTVSNE
jgi:glucosamine--fructose-6-phosphate aminotransferase (isomerizing)